jgi:hypothetical protein
VGRGLLGHPPRRSLLGVAPIPRVERRAVHPELTRRPSKRSSREALTWPPSGAAPAMLHLIGSRPRRKPPVVESWHPKSGSLPSEVDGATPATSNHRILSSGISLAPPTVAAPARRARGTFVPGHPARAGTGRQGEAMTTRDHATWLFSEVDPA